MSALSSAEVAAARADLATMLPDTATVQRKESASDGGGGSTDRWPEIAAGVPCRLAPVGIATGRGSGIAAAGGRLNDATTHIVTFAAGYDVQLEDRLVIGERTLEVLLVRDGGGMELARHAEAKEAV